MFKREFFKLSVLGLCAFLMSACASTGIVSDYDRRNDFGEYKTYSWAISEPVQTSGEYPVSDLIKQRIQDAAQASFAAKGFEFVDDPADADFTVSFTVGARDGLETTLAAGYYVIDGWGQAYYVAGDSLTSQYTEGSLSADIFDAASRRPVWHSAGTKHLTRYAERGVVENSGAAITEILASFPPVE